MSMPRTDAAGDTPAVGGDAMAKKLCEACCCEAGQAAPDPREVAASQARKAGPRRGSSRALSGVRKPVKRNSPIYGIDGQGWFLSFHCFSGGRETSKSATRPFAEAPSNGLPRRDSGQSDFFGKGELEIERYPGCREG